ncbi:DUF3310 domain-containing protein [Veillonella sp.]|uniref:DUF3310 domain-containing protein n=1 Tax=Veillonella TaxID=29465 RepID=UPI00205D9647|nr:DUF3310 domain-containing protein [Veillonella sp.]MDU1550875.1 DUF3310 domain-containing protein [Veillonella sp.]DAU95791.1 MAG TPA: nucelotide kinase [Caudoviricetes sp.]
MDQFIMAGLFGAIVIIVCYTTIQVMEIVDKRKYKTVYGLTPGRLYERPDNPPPPPTRLSASEELSRYIANEELRRFGEATNRFGINMGRNILDRPHRPSRPPEPPSHYTQGDIEVIDYIEDKKLGYRLGNVVKYVSRAGHKDDAIKDLKKASWYLNREIVKREEHDKSRASTN